jgi:hypothetical protein
MKRLILISVFVLAMSAGTAHALSNTPLYFVDYDAYFNQGFGSFFADPEFDIGKNGSMDGRIYSGVEVSKDGKYYNYAYKIEMYANTTDHISGFSLNWGSIAPLAFDFTSTNTYSATDDSWYTVQPNWAAGTIGPLFASYTGSDGVVRWIYNPVLEAGDLTAWVFLISALPPQLVDVNLLDGGPPEVAGKVYAPAVPEPISIIMLGMGLLGLGILGRRRK